jgi:hypothetical protein
MRSQRSDLSPLGFRWPLLSRLIVSQYGMVYPQASASRGLASRVQAPMRQKRPRGNCGAPSRSCLFCVCLFPIVLNYGANRISSDSGHLQIPQLLLDLGMTTIKSNSKRMFRAMSSPLRTTIRRSTALNFLYCSCSSAPSDAAPRV